ncbi:MAG: hypothetical protein JSW47_08580 [Phycisphaerales bacterium]|nr:MAG: hypothetical protein JSW47_08580 [Phycisphaerales bacterium]
MIIFAIASHVQYFDYSPVEENVSADLLLCHLPLCYKNKWGRPIMEACPIVGFTIDTYLE